MAKKLIVAEVRQQDGSIPVGALVFMQDTATTCQFGTVDDNGECPLQPDELLTDTQFSILAAGCEPYSCSVNLGTGDKQIRVGLEADPSRPQDVILPALSFKNAPVWRPTKEQVENFKGAFCVPDAFDSNPGFDLYGDGKRIWTPATLAYDESNWQTIIDKYKELNPHYTHYVINLGGSTYHKDYPHIPDDPARSRKLILLLLKNYLIPVCCATDDENPDVVLNSWIENQDVIDCGFVMWEMNGPCNGDPVRMYAIIEKTCVANGHACILLHFTAGHGAVDEPEGESWKKCQAMGIRGLASQDDHWDDPQSTASGLEDTAAHLAGKRAGWEGCNMINVAFEQTTTPVYHKYPGWTGTRPQKIFGNYLISHCPSIAGYMDGGSS